MVRMSRRRDLVTVASGSAAILAITLAFAALAIKTAEGEYFNRGGATILALTALFVVWQVTRERIADEDVRKHLETADAGAEARRFGEPSVIARMKSLSLAKVQIDLKEIRLIYVWFVAIVTAYGEVLHGWGDLILTGLGLVCPRK